MEDNSRNQRTAENQNDRTQESDRSKQDSRQNTSSNDLANQEELDRGNERRDRLPKGVPDNYERDAE